MLGEQINEILAKHRISVLETMTTPSRPGKKPRPVWVIKGDVYGLDSFLRASGARKFRGAWSCFENPSEALAKHLETEGREGFAEQVNSTLERKAARAERFRGYSENACQRSDNAYGKMDSILKMIPPGQPILAGHHSEARHRRDNKRMDNLMRKSVDESKKADYFRNKAESLAHDQNRLSNRLYISKQIEKAEKEIKSIQRYADHPTTDRALYDERISRANEKLTFWKNKLTELEQSRESAGELVPSSKTVKVGDEVFYCKWLPVTRVNRKTVTVSNWLGVPSLTYKLEYARISKVRPAGGPVVHPESQEG